MPPFPGDADNLVHEDYEGLLVHSGHYFRWSGEISPVSLIKDPVHVDGRVAQPLEVFSSNPGKHYFTPTLNNDREGFYWVGGAWAEVR